IAGLETPDGGAIALADKPLFDGNSGTAVPMYDRDIGMGFQSYAIWPPMSVFNSAAYPLRVSHAVRYSRADITKRVNNVLESVGLASYKDRSATKLSGGPQQRLALARGLVRK